MSCDEAGPVPAGHPDRIRWNARYTARFGSSFTPHPLAVRALALDPPHGPVADLACGPSGSALLAAGQGRRVTAVDISEVALGLLGDEARWRGLGHLITLVHADLSAWSPEPRSHALVLCTGFWNRAVFTRATDVVTNGGLLAWEALTAEARDKHPSLPAEWSLAPGEPASLLPPDFALIEQADEPTRARRCLLARRVGTFARQPMACHAAVALAPTLKSAEGGQCGRAHPGCP
ncbi:MAG: class I SAM-dependent methyltransferase [Streptosporangiaceae bacterium]|jgi:SAM-dependent methyltransferase